MRKIVFTTISIILFASACCAQMGQISHEPGIVVYRDDSLPADQYAQLFEYNTVIDRSAAGGGGRGYIIFSGDGGKIQCNASSVVLTLAKKDLNPSSLVTPEEIANYKAIFQKLSQASSINRTVEKQSEQMLSLMKENLHRVELGDTLQNGKWFTLQESLQAKSQAAKKDEREDIEGRIKRLKNHISSAADIAAVKSELDNLQSTEVIYPENKDLISSIIQELSKLVKEKEEEIKNRPKITNNIATIATSSVPSSNPNTQTSNKKDVGDALIESQKQFAMEQLSQLPAIDDELIGPKVKGVQIGMDIRNARTAMENAIQGQDCRLSDIEGIQDGHPEGSKYKFIILRNVNGRYVDYFYMSSRVEADSKGKVTRVILSGESGVVSTLFKSKDMSNKEFIQEFINQYNIKRVVPDSTGTWVESTNEDGIKVLISSHKDVIIKKVTSRSERDKNFN